MNQLRTRSKISPIPILLFNDRNKCLSQLQHNCQALFHLTRKTQDSFQSSLKGRQLSERHLGNIICLNGNALSIHQMTEKYTFQRILATIGLCYVSIINNHKIVDLLETIMKFLQIMSSSNFIGENCLKHEPVKGNEILDTKHPSQKPRK